MFLPWRSDLWVSVCFGACQYFPTSTSTYVEDSWPRLRSIKPFGWSVIMKINPDISKVEHLRIMYPITWFSLCYGCQSLRPFSVTHLPRGASRVWKPSQMTVVCGLRANWFLVPYSTRKKYQGKFFLRGDDCASWDIKKQVKKMVKHDVLSLCFFFFWFFVFQVENPCNTFFLEGCFWWFEVPLLSFLGSLSNYQPQFRGYMVCV